MTQFELILSLFGALNVGLTGAVWFRLGQLENLKDRVKRLEERILSAKIPQT